MHDAVDWKIIDENPFCKVKTQKSSVKVNEFVPREVVDKLMKKANPVWQVILGDKSEYVVAAPQYRAAANTAMGWKNSNLLTELRIENGEWRIEIHAGRRVLNNSPFSILHSQFLGHRG
jgi:hypothetical protein